jgi:hypothetical protein
MDIVQTMRQIVFLTLYTTLVTPTYLVLRFHTPEFLLLYAPILTFWSVLIYSHIEANQIQKSQEPVQ